MLKNILKTIDEKAEQEIKEILKKKQETIFALEKEFQKRSAEKKENLKKEIAEKIKEEIKEKREQKEREMNFKIQEEKNRILRETYEKAKNKILNLNAQEFEKIVSALLSKIPDNVKGEISAGKITADALKQIGFNKYAVTADLKDEGILFKAEDFDLDLTLTCILEQNREKTDPKVVKILFSE